MALSYQMPLIPIWCHLQQQENIGVKVEWGGNVHYLQDINCTIWKMWKIIGHSIWNHIDKGWLTNRFMDIMTHFFFLHKHEMFTLALCAWFIVWFYLHFPVVHKIGVWNKWQYFGAWYVSYFDFAHSTKSCFDAKISALPWQQI